MKTRPTNHGFTLLELMTVLLVISILTAMVVGVAGMVQTKSAKARAKTEIAMLSLAADNYKNDNGRMIPLRVHTVVISTQVRVCCGLLILVSLSLFFSSSPCCSGSHFVVASTRTASPTSLFSRS